MEEVRILVAEALNLPITDIVIQTGIVGWLALGASLVSATISAVGAYQQNQDAQDYADTQEALTKARAKANRTSAKFQYQQAKDQAEIARTDAEFNLEQSKDAYAMGMGQNAAGFREATQQIGLQEESIERSFEVGMENIERSRDQAIEEVQYRSQTSEAQLAAAGGRGGSARNRLMENIARTTGNVTTQTQGNIEGLEYQTETGMKKLGWAERSALRKKRSGIIQMSEQMETVENQYNQLMGGEGYGDGTIAERLESAKQQRDSVIGAGDYAASEMNVENYSGGYGTADLMTASAAAQRQNVYDQYGGWNIVNSTIQGAAQGFSIFSNTYSSGQKIGLWGNNAT